MNTSNIIHHLFRCPPLALIAIAWVSASPRASAAPPQPVTAPKPTPTDAAVPPPASVMNSDNPESVVTVTTKGAVDVGLMYNGDFIYFFGTVPEPDADVVVKLVSTDDARMTVNRKGRVGLFWMNVKQFEVTGLPLLYKIHSTRPISQVMDRELARDLGLGYDVLADGMKVKTVRGETAADDREKVFNGVLDLKKKSNLYNVDEKRIEITGGKIFKHYFRFPPAAKEGTYVAESYIIKNGKLLSKGIDKIVIQKTGIEATFTSMAVLHPVFYGILCVVVALGMGLLVGVIFKKGGGH